MKNGSRDVVPTQSRHPEHDSGSINVGLSRKGRTLREKWIDSGSESGMTKNCHAELVSASIHRDNEGSPLTPTLSRRARGKRVAFTLAEVLITLAIIGVVAAMTIPTLVQGYKKKVTSTRLKQYYSAMLNAIALSKIDNGNKWYKTSIDNNYDEDGTLNYEKAYENASKFFKVYLAPYFKYSEDTILEDGKVTLNNGTQIIFWHGECIDMNIDINGEAKPNEANRDIFYFKLCLEDEPLFQTGRRNSASMTREELVEQCKENENSIPYCTELLRRDGWEFKDDYPYKL